MLRESLVMSCELYVLIVACGLAVPVAVIVHVNINYFAMRGHDAG